MTRYPTTPGTSTHVPTYGTVTASGVREHRGHLLVRVSGSQACYRGGWVVAVTPEGEAVTQGTSYTDAATRLDAVLDTDTDHAAAAIAALTGQA